MDNKNYFDFKMRDKLKKMFEYWIFRRNLSHAMITTETGVTVTAQMLVDMITFCSQGDLNLAIRGLQASRQLVTRVVSPFLRQYICCIRYAKGIKLLFEIWRLGFIRTKCVLDWNENFGEQNVPPHRLLEQQITAMNNLINQVNVSSSERLEWINNSIHHFENQSLVVNELWKNKKTISEVKN